MVRSVGYRGLPLAGLPFDERRSVIPNEAGRMLRDGVPVPGGYVSRLDQAPAPRDHRHEQKDAAETVASLLADAAAGSLPLAPEPAPEAVDALLAARGVDVVDYDGWRAIDTAEVALGATRGRDRTTLHQRDDLLAAARTD